MPANRPLERRERSMVLNILNFGELKVADIMVPRADIIAVEASTPIARPGARFSAMRSIRACRCTGTRSITRSAWFTSKI